MSLSEAALIVARFVHYSALTLAFGSALFPLYAYGRDDDLRERVGRRLGWLLPVSAAVALASGLAWLAASAAVMADDPKAAFDPATLLSILTEMDFGRVWVVRLVLAVLLIIVAVTSRGSRDRFRLTSPLLAGVLLASIAATGHATSGSGGLGLCHRLADAAHLMAAGAWLGALASIAALARSVSSRTPEATSEVARVLARFSKIGYLAVATLIATGLINAWLLVGRVDALLTTPYGRVLLVKLGLFVAMLGFAALNRLQVTPALSRLTAADDPRPSLAKLRWHVLAEQGLGVAVLALVSVLGTLASPVSM